MTVIVDQLVLPSPPPASIAHDLLKCFNPHHAYFLTFGPIPRKRRQNILWRCHLTTGCQRYWQNEASSRDLGKAVRHTLRDGENCRACFPRTSSCVLPLAESKGIRTYVFFSLLSPAKTSKPYDVSASITSSTPKNQTCRCRSILCCFINPSLHLAGPLIIFPSPLWPKKWTG